MSMQLILHGLAVKKHAEPAVLADFSGLPAEAVSRLVAEALAGGRVIEAQGKLTLAPLARVALGADYARTYAALRASASFVSAYETFERINVQLKALITDWQTIRVGGALVPNTHADRDYDLANIDRLGELHERADRVLAQLSAELSRFSYYRRGLLAALEKAEAGAIEWVSDARIPSYHTLWFEMHEDLLRILGRQRAE